MGHLTNQPIVRTFSVLWGEIQLQKKKKRRFHSLFVVPIAHRQTPLKTAFHDSIHKLLHTGWLWHRPCMGRDEARFILFTHRATRSMVAPLAVSAATTESPWQSYVTPKGVTGRAIRARLTIGDSTRRNQDCVHVRWTASLHLHKK